jgi:hypothetical protein
MEATKSVSAILEIWCEWNEIPRENVLLLTLGIGDGLREESLLLYRFGFRILIRELKELRGPLPPSPQKLIQRKKPHLADAV